jgi:fructokinase
MIIALPENRGATMSVVAVLGECVADAFTAPGAPSGGPLGLEVWPGGGPANTAVTLARLGTPTLFVGRLSSDPFGRMFRARLTAAGADLGRCPDAAEPSTLAVADLDAEGRASYTFHAEGTADWQWTRAELAAALPATPAAAPACLHTGSLALVRAPGAALVEELLAAHRPHTAISVDPNVRTALASPEFYRERLPGWCAAADLLRLSDDDLAVLLPGARPEEACERLHALGARLVVITLGARGSLASFDGHRVTVPAAPANVVDTVGAGDAFMGGLLHHLHTAGLLAPRLPGLTAAQLPAALRTASRVAAATCEQRGAEPPWGVPGER